MKIRRAIRILLRLALGSAVLALIFVGIGMLPGRIEGVYRGMGVRCMCNGTSFMQFRDGKVITFNSSHSPADIFGRYETNADGSVTVFRSPYYEGESEALIFTAIPRFWCTRFKSADGNTVEWHWKSPVYGTVKKTIADHEVSSSMLMSDRIVVKTIYNSALEELRRETKQLKRQ